MCWHSCLPVSFKKHFSDLSSFKVYFTTTSKNNMFYGQPWVIHRPIIFCFGKPIVQPKGCFTDSSCACAQHSSVVTINIAYDTGVFHKASVTRYLPGSGGHVSHNKKKPPILSILNPGCLLGFSKKNGYKKNNPPYIWVAFSSPKCLFYPKQPG